MTYFGLNNHKKVHFVLYLTFTVIFLSVDGLHHPSFLGNKQQPSLDWVIAAEMEKCLSKKTVIKELHQQETKTPTEVVFTTAAALCQHRKNCFVYTIFCAFYILLTTTTQPCTIQRVSPCFKLQLQFIELKKGVLSVQSSGHAMRVVIKWQEPGTEAGTDIG